MPFMRINPDRIKSFGTQHRARGGKGEVTLASLIPRPTDESQSEARVAVKKLYFTGDSNLRQFYNVRPRWCRSATLTYLLFIAGIRPRSPPTAQPLPPQHRKVAWIC